MEILIVAGISLVLLLGFVLGLSIIYRRLEKRPSMKKRPSTLRPSDPPKGQNPLGYYRRQAQLAEGMQFEPLTTQEDYWLPCVQPRAALGRLTGAAEGELEEEVARGVPSEPVEWTCSYCETVNRDVATCSNCGAPCQVSEKIEAVRGKQPLHEYIPR